MDGRSGPQGGNSGRDASAATHRILSLAQQIAIREPSQIRSIGSVIQGKAAVAGLAEEPQQLARMLTRLQVQYGVSDAAMKKLGSHLEMVVAFHQLAQLQVNTFVRENAHLDPIYALQKAIAVPRSNVVGAAFKASWQQCHDSMFNSQFNSNMFSTVGSLHSTIQTTAMAGFSTRIRGAIPKSRLGRRTRPVAETSHLAHTVWCIVALLAAAYLFVRVWDGVNLFRADDRPERLVYRLTVTLVEAVYAVASLAYLRLQWHYAASSQPRYRRNFKPEALVTVLYASDESADTLVAAVMAHTHARRPRRIPIKLVVIAQTYTREVTAARERIAKLVSNVTFLDHQQLADHEPGTALLDNAVPVIETMAVPGRMTIAQALYLCLTGIAIKYPLDNVIVTVSDASVMVNQAEHYRHAISRLSRDGTALVSFPCTPRNEAPAADLLDLGLRQRTLIELPAAQLEGHCTVAATCFAARAPELFSVLRAMELDSAGSRTLDWLLYYILADAANATGTPPLVAAPPATVLVQKHGRSRLAARLFTVMESWDVAAFLARQLGLRWSWSSGLSVPHHMNRAAILLELTIVAVLLIAAWARVPPASPANVLLACLFLLYYGAQVAAGLLTARGFRADMLGTLLSRRALAPALMTVYAFASSRFGVDRRGHFQSVGNITTAQLWGIKGKGGVEGDGAHVPLMQVANDEDELSSESERSIWQDEEPDLATINTWNSFGFSSRLHPEITPGSATPAFGASHTPSFTSYNVPSMLSSGGSRMRPLGEGRSPRRTGGVPVTHPPVAPAAEESPELTPPGSPRPLGEAHEANPRSTSPSPPPGSGYGGGEISTSELPLPRSTASAGDSEAMYGGPRHLAYWNAPPMDLPQKVTQQEFTDHAAALAARGPAATGSAHGAGGARGAAELDMRTWRGDRTGAGVLTGLSPARVALAVTLATLLAAAALSAGIAAVVRLFYSGAFAGYTMAERFAGSPWSAASLFLSAYVTLPPLVLLANAVLPPRALSALVHNRVAAGLLLTLSALALLAVPAVHIHANVVAYDVFTPAAPFVPLRELASASVSFMALNMAGAVTPGIASPPAGHAGRRGLDESQPEQPSTGRSLSAGWFTGPGLAKTTAAQAAAIADVAFAVTAFREDLRALGVMPALQAQLLHGAGYLLNAYSFKDGSLVSHVAPGGLVGEREAAWERPEDLLPADLAVVTVNATSGTDTFALAAAAMAATFAALDPEVSADDEPERGAFLGQLRDTAWHLWEKHVDIPGTPAAESLPALAAVWPTRAATLQSAQYYAAAWLAVLRPDDVAHRSRLNYYYSYAEETQDWKLCSVDLDTYFLTGNAVMTLVESFDKRYSLHLERCIALWMGRTRLRGERQSAIVHEVAHQLLLERTAVAPAVGTAAEGPRPLPLAMRAMALTAYYVADRREPEDAAPRPLASAACFAVQQLRMALGHNSEHRSYVAGVSVSGTRWPQQPRVRMATCDIGGPCGPDALAAAGANKYLAYGAFVHGPSVASEYSDSRQDIEASGTSILNSTPLFLLVAALQRMAIRPQDCLGLGLGIEA